MSITLLIIIATGIISWKAIGDRVFLAKMCHIPSISHEKSNWYRLLSSGFVHNGWIHLLVNMYVFFQFGEAIEVFFHEQIGTAGRMAFLVFYLSAIVASSLPTQIKHKNNPAYSSLGASGAVSAVVFAYIFLAPQTSLYILFIPFPMPAWLLGLGYLVYSYIMTKKGLSMINHDAHLTGALFGIAVICLIYPQKILEYLYLLIGNV